LDIILYGQIIVDMRKYEYFTHAYMNMWAIGGQIDEVT
jgi:hypothetical protein